MKLVFLGLSITSSWGNGHATTYRGLVCELARRGHDVLFLERDVPWYAANRDLPCPPYGRTELYAGLDDLARRFTPAVREAAAVVVGSYVPEGVAVGEWVLEAAQGLPVFYDIDTPVTLARLERGETEYVSRELVPRFALYLSFTGGPILERLERQYGARMARVLYCSADPAVYFPEARPARWNMGYMGTYGADRQQALESLLLAPARRWRQGRFVVAGPLYPAGIAWPPNVERVDHVPPGGHREFYNSQRLTLNITRADMRAAGWSPSVRLFEAAACGVPILSDCWPGMEAFFEPGREILVAASAAEALEILRRAPERELRAMALRARRRMLAEHTPSCRAAQLERYIEEAAG